jgi:hypothetical protein
MDWLLGKYQVSKPHRRRLRFSIKKQLRTLANIELLLLLEKGFDINLWEYKALLLIVTSLQSAVIFVVGRT